MSECRQQFVEIKPPKGQAFITQQQVDKLKPEWACCVVMVREGPHTGAHFFSDAQVMNDWLAMHNAKKA